MARYAKGQGGLPLEITEADLCERFGWTFTQLDEEDQDRVYRAVTLSNMRGAVDRIKTWLDHQGKIHISGKDLEIMGMLWDAEKESDNA